MKIFYNNKYSIYHTSGWIDRDTMQEMKQIGWQFDGKQKYWYTKMPLAVLPFRKYLVENGTGNLDNTIKCYRLSNAVAPGEDFAPPQGALPQGIREYQKAAVERMLMPGDVMVCDQMGLGKTLEAIAAICVSAYQKEGGLLTVVIVCPAHLKGVWFNELLKFSTVDCAVHYYNGSKRGIAMIERGTPYKINAYIVNYDILEKRLVDLEASTEEKYDYVLFDESHYLKNMKAKRTKAAFKLCSIAKKRVFLSGTPVTKSPIDLYPVLKMIHHPLADNWYYYATTFCDAKKKRIAGREVWIFSVSNPEKLSLILKQTCMLRREKEAVLKELPKKTKQIISLDPDEVLVNEEKEILNAEKISYDDFLKNGHISFSPPAARKLALVRQKIALYKAPATLQFCSDILESEEKLVIFAHHKAVMEALKKAFENHYSVAVITGDTFIEERNRIITAFQKSENPRIIIASLTCAGTGITLTRASTAVFAELDWIPATIEQAEDRIHRIGQENAVNIYYMVVRNTLEHYIAQRMIDRAAKIADIF